MKYLLFLLLLTMFVSKACDAHTINYILHKSSNTNIFLEYVQLGFTHILPFGLDHILFIICVFFLNTNIKAIIKQATLFTIAHSITLALVACNMIVVPTQIVEPIIALSIAILAIENIFFNSTKPYRFAMIFLFGLVHGMGFAGALAELGLPSYAFTTALVSFNFGVELGQLTIIVLLFVILKLFLENKIWYRSRILIPANVLIGIVALYWTIERM
jgi:HupE / UreJ protein